MNRKAILIESSAVAGQRDLPGARVDIANWIDFLKSNLGGAWTDAEMAILRKPPSSQVIAELKVPTDTYTFVAFSGHGADGRVVLNDRNSSFSISDMKPTSSRGVLIVDSCRGVETSTYNFSVMANRMNSMVLANAKVGRSTVIDEAKYPALYRSIWENGFTSSTGIVQMLACARGQGAEEDPEAGGYYTSLLMAGAELWTKEATVATTYSTREAHDHAARNLSSQQTPEYAPSGLGFPFAAKFKP
jgi:hypothetical protein